VTGDSPATVGSVVDDDIPTDDGSVADDDTPTDDDSVADDDTPTGDEPPTADPVSPSAASSAADCSARRPLSRVTGCIPVSVVGAARLTAVRSVSISRLSPRATDEGDWLVTSEEAVERRGDH
jgi:hypothetical protein